MFTPKSPQTTLLDAEFFLSASKRQRLESSWAGVFREEIFPLLLELEPRFARFYHPEHGAPNKPVAVLLGLNVLQDLFDLSDGEVVEAFDFNAQWHYALASAPERAHVCAKTLFRFRGFLATDELAREVFERATDRLVAKWNVRTSEHRLDSTHLLSNIARLNRLGLFVRTIEQFLARLERKSPELLAALPADLRKRYLGRRGYFANVKGSDAQRRLEQCAEDARLLVERFAARRSVAALQAYRNLARLFAEQCVVVPEPSSARVAVKAPQEVASDSLQNPSDPDVTYSGHKGQGYQAQIAETCHPDNVLQLIDYVETEGAHESDSHAPERVHENLKARGHAPQTTYADAAYISGKNLLAAEADGIVLHGPTQLGKAPKEDKAPLSDFAFAPDRRRVVRCAAGQAPTRQADSKDGEVVNAHFDKAVCEACARNARCRAERQKGSWVLRFTQAGVAVGQRRVEQADAAFQEAYKIRSGIEATNSQLKNRLGLGRLRVRGSPAVSLRVYFKNLAENCSRVIRYVQKRVRAERMTPARA